MDEQLKKEWTDITLVIGLVVVGFNLFGTPKLADPYILPGMHETVATLLDDPNISDANIYNGVTTNASGKTTRVDVGIRVKKMPSPSEVENLGDLILNQIPAAKDKDELKISITHGYTIGIAYHLTNYTYTGSPQDWETNPSEITINPQGINTTAGIGTK